MYRIVFSGLAAVLALTAFAQTQANAGEFRKRSGLSASKFAVAKSNMPRRRATTGQRRIGNLGHRGRSTSANTAAHIQALTVYLQWRKCLDNMLPKCP